LSSPRQPTTVVCRGGGLLCRRSCPALGLRSARFCRSRWAPRDMGSRPSAHRWDALTYWHMAPTTDVPSRPERWHLSQLPPAAVVLPRTRRVRFQGWCYGLCTPWVLVASSCLGRTGPQPPAIRVGLCGPPTSSGMRFRHLVSLVVGRSSSISVVLRPHPLPSGPYQPR
jgi:hypothetical protein